ncbi:hypothetical protein [Planococcus sp. CAU13]|uniref:hypothetical protein n=1 Tax=Planococcus sp. CAU13 TaxID=1541197 RepID=UPI00052FE8F3|nr:hypothetical protein [Planococcus sp. CAU13]
MKKSDAIVADITIYAMKQIQMAKYDLQLTGEEDYWNGEIKAMKYLLLHMDKLVGRKANNDLNMPDLIAVFDRVDEKRKEKFNFFWERIWDNDIDV